MTDIVDFAAEKQKREPHACGEARCVDCGHTWAAVAPIGVHALECPRCLSMRGVWVGLHSPPDGSLIFRCACGNTHFNVLAGGAAFCIQCGYTHSRGDLECE